MSGLDVSDAIITLTDDDKSTTGDPNDKDGAELSVAGPTSNVSEGGNAVFTVTLSAAVDAEVTGGMECTVGDGCCGGSGLVRYVGNCDVCGEQRSGGDAEHHDHGDGRHVVGEGGVVHGDAGGHHVHAVVAGVFEDWGQQCHGYDK